MRIRSKLLGETLIPGGQILYSLNGSTPSYPGPAFNSQDFYAHFVPEEMIDKVTVGKGTKSVKHVKYEFYGDSGGRWKYHSGSDVVEDTGPNALWWGHGRYPSYAGPLSENQFHTEYSKSVQDQLNGTIDKFNSTNEVDNILNIAEAHQIPSALNSLVKTVNQEGTIQALRKRPSKGSLLGNLSNGFLAWSFGIAPLISDMKTMSKACKNLHSDMQKDRGRRAQIDTVSTQITGKLVRNVQADWFPGYFTSELAVPVAPKRVVGVKGIRTQQYDSKVFADLDYLLRKFGGPGPASFVWEKIPYSFVVDWFFNLKGITDKLDNLLTGNTKQISDAWYSESYKGFWRSRIVNPNAISPSIGTTVFSNAVEVYTRNPISASRSAVTLAGRFGKKQLALTGALLYQKVARR
jgi:hypothetical protein